MAACPLCRSRKGKRSCPALRSEICSACCGEKRIVEVACPADCVYLGRGTENEMMRAAGDYIRHQDPRKSARWLQAMRILGHVLETVERTIAAAPVPNLEDDDLLVALEAARKTFESETKGILYESLPTSPTLQVLAREIVEGIRALSRRVDEERRRQPAIPPVGPAEAVETLTVVIDRCEYHVRRKTEAGSLVAHLRRTHRPERGLESSPPASRIVLT